MRDADLETRYSATGTGYSLMANRISWFYGLQGTSLCVDTYCSSSLIALHLACNNLRGGESKMALVGGSNLLENPDMMSQMANLNLFSPDGRSYSFDHRANGYSRGEGVGIVILKPIKDAIKDGNLIRAVIRATGSNHDGHTPSMTQPNGKAHEALIRQTYTSAGLDLASTRFFEAHGTGTPTGDPIEIEAVASVFREHRSSADPLIVGAIKSNIGHLEGASGIASLIKTILVLEKGVIPPNSNFERVNPKIKLDEWGIKASNRHQFLLASSNAEQLPLTPMPWPSQGPRRASVNSFGLGGTNGHVVIDDAAHYCLQRGIKANHATSYNGETSSRNDSSLNQLLSPSSTSGMPRLVVLSAADESGIARVKASYAKYLANIIHDSVGDVMYFEDFIHTLSTKRSLLMYRSFSIVDSPKAMLKVMEVPTNKPARRALQNKIGFVFTGQGAQWLGMGKELMAYKVFRDSICKADAYLKGLGCNWSPMGMYLCHSQCRWLILPATIQSPSYSANINDPEVSQTILTVLQVALVDLMRSWRLFPAAVIGHSSGEVAAAYCSNLITCESSWKVAYYRGIVSTQAQLTAQCQGGMMAVGMTREDFAGLTGLQDIVVACYNSPSSLTLSGSREQLNILQKSLDEKKVFNRMLKIPVAYHSPRMEPVAEEYKSLVGRLSSPPSQQDSFVRMFSTVTKTTLTASQAADAGYWAQNLVSPVEFSDGLAVLLQDDELKDLNLLVELGPHSFMQRPVKDVLIFVDRPTSVQYFPSLLLNRNAHETVLEMAGQLFILGVNIDLGAVNSPGHDVTGRRMLIDLPEYPFNHTTRHWLESRVSMDYKSRKHPPHQLLGTLNPSSTSFAPMWRNYLRQSDLDWIKDHKVDDVVLYPAAGMLTMSIEALRQLSSGADYISAIRFQGVTFVKAMQIPDDNKGLETNIILTRQQRTVSKFQWYDFLITSYEYGSWQENCRGRIMAEFGCTTTEKQSRTSTNEMIIEAYRKAFTSCVLSTTSDSLYTKLNSLGFGFGTTFKTMHKIRYNEEGAAIVSVKPAQWQSTSISPLQPHLIHPTTLDAIIQCMFPALSAGGTKQMSTIVPTALEEMWLSGDILNIDDSTLWDVSACATWAGMRTATANIAVVSQTSLGKAQAWIRELKMTAISKTEKPVVKHEKLCFGIDMQPDLSLMDNASVSSYCSRGLPREVLSMSINDLEAVCFIWLSRLLQSLPGQDSIDATRPWLSRYVAWARSHMQRIQEDDFLYQQLFGSGVMASPERQREILDRLTETGTSSAQLYRRIGENLAAVLTGQQDALPLIFQDSLIDDEYLAYLTRGNLAQKLTKYLDTLAHKDPNMHILEIGAGTGSGTSILMNTLSTASETGVARFSKYTFTDLSPSFFEKAKKKFAHDQERLDFAVLNIANDPLKQGFAVSSYDMVVAVNVLHATADLSQTLRNVRLLLRPGGKLVLIEPCNTTMVQTTFVYGLLEGWWLGKESSRQLTPLLPEQDWSSLLRETGFSGTDVCLRDNDNPNQHLFTSIIATAVDPKRTSIALSPTMPKSETVAIVISLKHHAQYELARALQNYVHNEQQMSCELITSGSVRDFSYVLYLLEMDEPVFANLSGETLVGLKAACQHNKNILWVTQSTHCGNALPTYSLITGWARCLRAEVQTLKFTVLALNKPTSDQPTLHKIKQVLNRWVTHHPLLEEEYQEQDSLLCIPRIVPDTNMERHVEGLHRPSEPQAMLLKSASSTALQLTISSPGILKTMHFVPDDSISKPLGISELEVEMNAIGINHYDLLVLLGQHPSNLTGLEGSGTVKSLPADYSGDLCIGDRVCGLFTSAFRTYARTNINLVTRIPSVLDFTTAAGLPVAYITSYVSLFDQARFDHDQTILIHSGAGGVGQAAIELARLKTDAKNIFTTVGMNEKKQFLVERFGIPLQNILDSRDPFMDECIMKLTSDRGVDVVLNSLNGEALRRSLNCVAPFGHFVEISLKDAHAGSFLPMRAISKGVSISSVNLAMMIEQAPEKLIRVLKNIVKLVENLQISPYIDSTYGMGNLETALRRMQSGQNRGKMIVEFRPEEEIMAVLDVRSSFALDPAATYVISGLGGLGRCIARWLVKRGAKHLLLLSRSGSSAAVAVDLLHELRAQGIQVELPACDVSDVNALSKVLEETATKLPPIKGCIQGAMVLKDAIFENMSLNSWNAALRPKVNGSWNLHRLLPKDLDFFILLSSLNGVLATKSQSNYGAGNTYQDALAHHRIFLGEKATSIDVGKMVGVGYVAEKQEDRHSFMLSSWNDVDESSLYSVLEHACNPSTSKAQVAIGIAPQALLKSRGLEAPWWAERPYTRVLSKIVADHDNSDGVSNSSDSKWSTNPIALLKANAAHGSDVEGEKIVLTALIAKLSRTLSAAVEDFDPQRSMNSYGADSLVAIEMKNWLLIEFGIEMAVFEILDNMSIQDAGKLILGRWRTKEEKK